MFSIFYKLRWFIKKHWVKYVVAITFLNIASLISVIPPKIIQIGIDQINNKTITSKSLLLLVMGMVLIAIVGYFVSFLWTFLLFGTGNKLEYTIRKDYFEHLLKMDNKFYERNAVGDLMARATSDLGQVAQTCGYGILALTDATVYLAFILIMMMTISFKLTIASLLPLPFVVIGVKILGEKIHKNYTESQNAFSTMNNKVLESVSGVRVVRAYVQEEKDIKRLEESAEVALNKNINLIKIDALFDPLFKTVFTIAYTITFSYGIYLVFNQNLTPGQLVAFSVYLGQLGWPMFALGDAVNVMQRGNASYDRIQNIMSQNPEVVEPTKTIDIGNILECLTFKDVSFKYPNGDFNVIENINFNLIKGHTLGIVGKTGSGKTTILRQILKQYNPNDGIISINGYDIKELNTKDVRNFFGYVPQEHVLFTGSVYKNIAFGNKDATDEEINNAIDLAAFRKDIEFLDEGLETIVGEQGVTLSGGQKQRLSIARAIVMNPEVLILDDSLSAVDGTTEKAILKNLKLSRNDKTTIIVAHRLSAVEHADEIIVLDDGKIIERGNHETLMKLDGWYAKQYNHQQMMSKKGGEN